MSVEVEFPAMGTTIWARVSGEESVQPLINWFRSVEDAASRFDPASELSRLNGSPAEEVEVAPMLAELLRVAAAMQAATGGLVDPSVGGTVAAWGYDRTFAGLRPPSAAPDWQPIPAWRIHGNIVVRRPGTVLDLGGIAKGWTCDRAVGLGLASVASAGGDLRSSDPRLVVDVLEPAGDVAASVRVGARALATSSVARRRWRVGSISAHHLIDPRTGSPAVGPVVSATVVAGDAVAAEAGAKAVLLHGVDGLAWAASTPWIDGALAVWADGSVYATNELEVAA